jgi:hypothetical protein
MNLVIDTLTKLQKDIELHNSVHSRIVFVMDETGYYFVYAVSGDVVLHETDFTTFIDRAVVWVSNGFMR